MDITQTPSNTSAQATSFPQEIEVTLKLRLKVEDQEDRDYWIDPQTGELSVSCIADMFEDVNGGGEVEVLISVNGITHPQMRALLNSKV